MKRIAIVTVALCMVLSLIMGGAALAAAQKLDLRANPPRCDVPATTAPVAGFVILNNDNETDEVVVVVSLKDGYPDRTYYVFLEDYKTTTGGPANWKAWAYLGPLTANSKGKGNFDTRVSRLPDEYYLQIVVCYPWGSWGAESFGTDIATVEIK